VKVAALRRPLAMRIIARAVWYRCGFRSESMKVRVAYVCALVLVFASYRPAAQSPASQPDRIDALFKDLKWRNIGPANMAGRVTDIDAVESNPAIVYVAAASGGVWKSVNAGTTWEPIFTNYGTSSIGDVSIFQKDPNIVWVGTGEGMRAKQRVMGRRHLQVDRCGQDVHEDGIGRDGAHRAASSRIRRTRTSCTSRRRDTSGVTTRSAAFSRRLTAARPGRSCRWTAAGRSHRVRRLVMDPANPNILYASLWERIRKPYVFESGGPNGGLFKSTNGGETWTKLGGGLPSGSVGKIGLTVFRRNGKILTAIVEAPRSTDAKVPGPGIYRSEDAGVTWTFMNPSADRPFYYNHIYLDPNNAMRCSCCRCRRGSRRTAARRSRARCPASKATSMRCGSTRRTAIGSTSRTTRARR
jgi:hypothetical protein